MPDTAAASAKCDQKVHSSSASCQSHLSLAHTSAYWTTSRDVSGGANPGLIAPRHKLGCGVAAHPYSETTMEKTEGCNHMICSGCGIHICWVCLATFGASGPCCGHMNKVHGGIGLDDLALLGEDMF